MASNQQDPAMGRKHDGSMREQAHEMGQRVRERTEHLGGRMRAGYDMTREAMAHRYRQAEGIVARNPTSSVLIGFGLGVGVGMMLGMMLGSRESSWYDRYMPDAIRGLPDRMRHLPDRLRHIPEAVSEHMPRH